MDMAYWMERSFVGAPGSRLYQLVTTYLLISKNVPVRRTKGSHEQESNLGPQGYQFNALTSVLCVCGFDRNAGELFSKLSSTPLHSTCRRRQTTAIRNLLQQIS